MNDYGCDDAGPFHECLEDSTEWHTDTRHCVYAKLDVKCAAGESCNQDGDCESGVCTGGTCAAPTCDDGVQNGDETDVDCGGSCVSWQHQHKTCKIIYLAWLGSNQRNSLTLTDARVLCLRHPECKGLHRSYCSGGVYRLCDMNHSWIYNSDSEPSEYGCTYKYPVVGMCAINESCNEHTDCDSGKCTNNICVDHNWDNVASRAP